MPGVCSPRPSRRRYACATRKRRRGGSNMTTLRYQEPDSRRGTAAVIALVAVTVLVGLCGAMLMIASRSNSEGGATIDRHQASSAAQAGIAHALVQLNAGDESNIDP